MKVWIVTENCPVFGYTLIGAFSNKESAEKCKYEYESMAFNVAYYVDEMEVKN